MCVSKPSAPKVQPIPPAPPPPSEAPVAPVIDPTKRMAGRRKGLQSLIIPRSSSTPGVSGLNLPQ